MSFRYEYKILNLSLMSESHLNVLALSGWRLIAVTNDSDNASTFYLEREYKPKEEEAKEVKP